MTDNSLDPDQPDNTEIVRLMREAVKKSRGYADFFEWPTKPSVAECHIAQLVCNFLVHRGAIGPGQVSSVESDPPDAVCLTSEGLRIGIEVTELVSSDTVARARHLKKQGCAIAGLMAEWNPESVARELRHRIELKDRTLAKVASSYHQIFLAIHTDELMIDGAVAQLAAASCTSNTQSIDGAFLILSYHPQADETVYPNKHPIVPIPISRCQTG